MIFVLLVIIFMHGDDPVAFTHGFQDKAECQIIEGQVLDNAAKDPNSEGFVVVSDCTQVDPAKKASLK